MGYHQDWYRTKKGIISTIYSAQKTTSKRRKMPPPSYTKDELSDWLLSQTKFHVFFDEWKRNDFDSGFRPSVDRIDDYQGYTLSNIQLMSWKDNQEKGYQQCRSGIVRKLGHQEVHQYTLGGDFIATYPSYNEAKRQTGVDDYMIAQCAKGSNNKQHAGGYKWRIY